MSQAIANPVLTVARGEDRTYVGTHQTSATDATPIDVTNWTIQLTVKTDPSGAPVLSKTATVTNGPAGTYTIAVAHAETLLDPGTYVMDIWRTNSGMQTLMGYGNLIVLPDLLY